jgi:uncharacterized repeat protein (TIGR01451 family)
MRHIVLTKSNERALPNFWQWCLIVVCTLILCSCRSAEVNREATSRAPTPQDRAAARPAGDIALTSAEIPIDDPAAIDAQQPASPDQPNQPVGGPWAPPGVNHPWPQTEYVRDGGTGDHAVAVDQQGRAAGLAAEDTVAHYKTLDGRTVTQPSNEVYIYTPRFAAVRQVVDVASTGELQRLGGVGERQKLETPASSQWIAKAKQNVQPDDRIRTQPASTAHSRQQGGETSTVIRLREFHDRFKPYEDLLVVRIGKFTGTESAFLARGSTAAAAWSRLEAVQITKDAKVVEAMVKYDKTMSMYMAELPPGKPALRLVKVASTATAKPGDTIDFTLRFDNVGVQPLANVTILDSLSGRLELLPESVQCTVDAKVTTHPNESESLIVRCETQKPLLPGQGGILRFRCIVR